MADHFARPERAATSREERVAELHRLANADYASTAHLRNADVTKPLYGSAALAVRDQLAQHDDPATDLQVAIRIAQQLVDSDQLLSVREALRLLLRALGAEPSSPSATDEPPAVATAPNGPGCGAAATVCIEGYSPRDGLAHGSLDHVVYTCAVHTTDARTDWLSGLTTYTRTGAPPVNHYCGDRYDYRTFGGGQ